MSRESSDLLFRGRLPEAEAALRRSLELVPGNPTRMYNLACILAAQGKTLLAMRQLNDAADAGFTDFTAMNGDPMLASLRPMSGYADLISRENEVRHHAADLGLAALRRQFGDHYLYDADEQHKLLFAMAVDQATFDRFHDDLLDLAAAEEREVFSHPPDEFIRVVLPTPDDFAAAVPLSHVGGIYDDSTRTVVAQRLGPFMQHEFTHALHAADQHALHQEHPVWLSEGLATLFETATFADGKLELHDNSRLTEVRIGVHRNTLPRLPDLLRMSRDDFSTRPGFTYGEASYLLRYLYGQKLLKPFYDNYTRGFNVDPSGAAALQQATGKSLIALQGAFWKWLGDLPAPQPATAAAGANAGINPASPSRP